MLAASQLGRVIEPEAVGRSSGPRGRIRVGVPVEWLREGASFDVTVPRRIACARCDGGGCDGCARSGALRAPDDADARTVRLEGPAARRAEAEPTGFVLRLVQPFGADHPIEQLLVEVTPADVPSPNVTRAARAGSAGRARGAATLGQPLWIIATVAIAAAFAVLLGLC